MCSNYSLEKNIIMLWTSITYDLFPFWFVCMPCLTLPAALLVSCVVSGWKSLVFTIHIQ